MTSFPVIDLGISWKQQFNSSMTALQLPIAYQKLAIRILQRHPKHGGKEY